MNTSEALQEVAAERRRQIEVEGWTTEHDDQHAVGVMASAAAAYALNASIDVYSPTRQPSYWPWSREWWKPKDRRRDLIRAAALIVAEIERLDRAADAISSADTIERLKRELADERRYHENAVRRQAELTAELAKAKQDRLDVTKRRA